MKEIIDETVLYKIKSRLLELKTEFEESDNLDGQVIVNLNISRVGSFIEEYDKTGALTFSSEESIRDLGNTLGVWG